MPLTVGYFDVLPIEDFSIKRKKNSSLLTKPQYSICAGLQYPILKNGILGAEVKFSQIANSSNGKMLRFSDMVDPEKGFVNPTNLRDVKINYAYHILSFGFSYQIEQNIGKYYTHRIGFKIEYDRLINSVYEIEAVKNNENMFYYNKDVKWYDYYWSVNYFLNYEIKLYTYRNNVFWLNPQYGFLHPYMSKEIKKDDYYKENNFHLLSLGIKVEI